jgi:lipoprotein-releasing system permease protein
MSYEILIAKRYLRAKRRTGFISLITYFSVGGVFLGTAALIIALAITNGFGNEVLSRIVGTFAHLKIQKYHGEGVAFYDSLAVLIGKHTDVVATAPFVANKVGISSRDVQDGVLLLGIDLEKERKVTDIARNLKFGHLTFDSTVSQNGRRLPGILIGTLLADRLRVDLGDEVTLMSLQAGETWHPGMVPRMGRFVLTGLVECGMYEYDANLCYVSVKNAQDLFTMGDSVTGIHARVRDIFRADKVGQEIQEKLGYPYYGLDWMAQNRTLFSWMKLEKAVVFAVILLIVLVAAFNIISSLIMVVIEKTKEIGILVSMGAKRKSIRLIFMLEGIVIGLAGTILGAAAGLALCYFQQQYHFIPIPGEVFFIDFLPVQVKWTDTAAVFAATNLLCFLATLYPANRAARLLPVDALRIG